MICPSVCPSVCDEAYSIIVASKRGYGKFEQVNRKRPIGARFYNFESPTPTLAPSNSYLLNLENLVIYEYNISLSWSRDVTCLCCYEWESIVIEVIIRSTIGYLSNSWAFC